MTDNSSSKRILYLDALRILSTYAVIVLHTAAQNWGSVDVHSFEWNCFNTWDSVVRWAVPVFVMISGALFLNPNRKLDVKKLYTKNILRIITAFLFWSVVYTLRTWHYNPGMLRRDLFITFAQGPFHMWFLFMIVGLYIIVPVVRLITANEKIMKYFLIVSFTFTIVVPTIESVAGSLLAVYPEDHWTVINNVFTNDVNTMDVSFAYGNVLYFVLGYYLSQHELSKRVRKLIYALSAVGFVSTILLTAFVSVGTGSASQNFYGYFVLNVFLEAVGVFVFFKYMNIDPQGKCAAWIQKISNWSFGVYLIHILVLDTLAGNFHLNTLSFSPVISVPVIAIIVFVIGTIVSAIIHKIPVLKKYVV